MAAHPTPADTMGAGEQLMQLDQAITLTLQEIDENFSQAHQAVTTRILPAIREYEAASRRTWQGARFWKRFFEASAQVSLSQQPLADAEASLSAQSRELGAESVRPSDDASRGAESDALQSPPRLSQSTYARPQELEPPLERLKRDVEQSRLGDVSASVVHEPTLQVGGEVPKSSSPLKARRRSSARPRVSIRSEGKEPATNPFSTEEHLRLWDGIADLRKTPLRSSGSRARPTHTPRAADSSDDESLAWPEGMSPPVTMQFSVPRSKYLAAPAKEAARMVVDDLLRTVDGKGSAPPSARRRQSVVGTPLSRDARRDSLPTPPTITKTHAPPPQAEEPEGTAARLLDEGEGLRDSRTHHESAPDPLGRSPRVSHIPGMLDRMLSVRDEEAPEQTAQGSSIEDDTLFGMPKARQGKPTESLAMRGDIDEMGTMHGGPLTGRYVRNPNAPTDR